MAATDQLIPNAYLSSKTSSKKRSISALTTYSPKSTVQNTITHNTIFNDTNIVLNILQYCNGNDIFNCRRINKMFLKCTYNKQLLKSDTDSARIIHIVIDSSRQMTLLYHALSRNVHCLEIVNSIEINYSLSDAQFPLLHALQRHLQIGRISIQPMIQFTYPLIDTYDVLNLVYKMKSLQKLELYCDMTAGSTDSAMSLTSRQIALIRRSCSKLQSITCTMHRIALNELFQYEHLTDATLHLTSSLHRQRIIDVNLASTCKLKTLYVNDSDVNCTWTQYIETLESLKMASDDSTKLQNT